ncbi:MAG: futalosine hydrolase [Bacteroidota bacterium]|nr:futalosine hydrolase [Bacteroidota bacterium]
MKILIVAATQKEVSLFKKQDIDILITGAGIPNTILNLTKHLSHQDYDLAINVGICGGFDNKYNIGEVVEVTDDEFADLGYEDIDGFHSYNNQFNIQTIFKTKDQTQLQSVKGITVNTVHGNEISINNIINSVNPDIETMEGAAFFMVCQRFNIRCIQIRAISNKVEKRNLENWDIGVAIKNLNKELHDIIDAL